MPKQIILLTGDTEFPFLSEALSPHNPSLEILHANSGETLDRAVGKCDLSPTGVRLVCFSSNVIVPGKILDRLGGPAYNLHPGPPEYPGSHPDSFALYAGATRFGATLHEMIAKVDAGPIVKVSEFDIPSSIDSLELAALAYQHIAKLFFELAAYFATNDRPLPHINRQWALRKTTNADFERMKNFGDALSEEEKALRRRAFG